jgi:hypothetical protein
LLVADMHSPDHDFGHRTLYLNLPQFGLWFKPGIRLVL